MPSDPWDGPWRTYPASKPIPVEGGVATSKQRGQMAERWWSQRFVQLLDSYGLGARMQRGRRYARQGQVMSIDVTSGLLAAAVQGSRRTPYVVTVQPPPLSTPQWSKVDDALRSRVGFVAQLMAGEVPSTLEDAFRDAGVALFPAAWRDMRARCSCPDPENPCKHIAAVLYVFADQLDADPWLLLLWRGRTRDEILDHIAPVAGAVGASDRPADLPPWWPLLPGRATAPQLAETVPAAEAPEVPHRVLQRLEPFEADVGGGLAIVDALAPVYAALAEPLAEGEP